MLSSTRKGGTSCTSHVSGRTGIGLAGLTGAGGGGCGLVIIGSLVMTPYTAKVTVVYQPRRTKPSVGTYFE